MRTRKPLATKVVSASSNGVTKHASPLAFREGRIKAYLNQLGMDVREYKLKASIRLETSLLQRNLITI